MSGQDYLRELKERLQSLDTKIADARQRLQAGLPKDKVLAAEDLAVLETRHRELEEKISAASEQHAEDWSTLHVELQKEVDVLTRSIERWVARH